MKHRWIGRVEPEPLPSNELVAVVETMLPGVDPKQLTPLTGGFRNRNYRVDERGAKRLLRVYAVGDRCAWKERRLAQLVEPTVRSPQYTDIQQVGERVVAVREFDEGRPLHELLGSPEIDAPELGYRVGVALAGIHKFEFEEVGDLNEELKVTEHYDVSGAGLTGYAKEKLASGVGAERIGAKLVQKLLGVLERCADEVEGWCRRPLLTHGDFGPTNLVLRPDGVVSVLDWEFGFSGSPMFDFGNLLRPPLETNEGFKRSLEEGYREAGGELPENWPRLAVMADTLAWAEFVSRPGAHELVISDARERMEHAILAE